MSTAPPLSSASVAPDGMSLRLWAKFVIISMIWGTTWIVIKNQLGEVPAAWSVTWRFLLAGVAMFGLCLFMGKRLRLGPGGHVFAMLMGLTQFMLNFNFVYRAEEHITSGLVALTFALLVVPNALLSRIFLGVSVSRQFLLGSALGIVGVGAMFARDILQSGGGGQEIWLGLGLAVGGLFSVSVANVLTASKRGRAQPLEAGIAWSMLYGTLMNAGVAYAMDGPPVISLAPGYLAGLAYLAILGSALAFIFYYELIRAIGAGRAAYTAVIVPLLAIIVSTIFEGYIWSPLAVAGAIMALAGLVIALRGR